jgi:exo-1,4-beta-D-glucosaminidase
MTTFDWAKTDYRYTPAARHENMTALASLPQAKITTRAEIENTPRGREIRVHFENKSDALAFQLRGAIRTPTGGLIAPVFWSDNWIELVPGESRTLTALLPENAGAAPALQIEGWNVAAETITPSATAAGAKE